MPFYIDLQPQARAPALSSRLASKAKRSCHLLAWSARIRVTSTFMNKQDDVPARGQSEDSIASPAGSDKSMQLDSPDTI